MRLLLLIFGVLVSVAAVAKQDVNILHLGKTGAGKSTLINVFYNHLTGKQFSDERRILTPLLHGVPVLVNVPEFVRYGVKLAREGKSQTSEVHRYPIETESKVINLWDTPGVRARLKQEGESTCAGLPSIFEAMGNPEL